MLLDPLLLIFVGAILQFSHKEAYFILMIPLDNQLHWCLGYTFSVFTDPLRVLEVAVKSTFKFTLQLLVRVNHYWWV